MLNRSLYFVIVSSGEAIPLDSNTLLVNWTVPTQCQGGKYEISYRLIRREACPEKDLQNSQSKTISSDHSSGEITGLEAFASYEITVSKSGDKGSPMKINGSTLSSGIAFKISRSYQMSLFVCSIIAREDVVHFKAGTQLPISMCELLSSNSYTLA